MDQSGNIYEFVQNVKTIICLIVKCAEIQKNYSEACKKTNIMLKYKVYLYEILGGKPYGKPVRVLEGEGKVVKMHYVDPSMSMVSYDYFPNSF